MNKGLFTSIYLSIPTIVTWHKILPPGIKLLLIASDNYILFSSSHRHSLIHVDARHTIQSVFVR